jgi:hypothetical protein
MNQYKYKRDLTGTMGQYFKKFAPADKSKRATAVKADCSGKRLMVCWKI